MIQRRTFLGVATGAALCLATRDLAAKAVPRGWSSTEIRTQRHGKLKSRPVVTGVSLQDEGNLLAIVGDDHYVSLYDIQAERFVDHLKGHTDWVRDAKFSPDSKMLFTCGNDQQLFGWKADQLTSPEFKSKRKSAIIKLAVSNDSTKLATVGFNPYLMIHDATSGREIQKLRCACADNHAVAFSADNKLVAAGGRCGTIRVWDLESTVLLHQFAAHRRRVRSLEFMKKGALISVGEDQIVKVNNLSDESASFALPRHAAKLFAIKVVSESIIATAGSDNRIHVWNLDNQSEINVLSRHTGTVTSLDVAQGLLVSGSFDTTVRIWTPDPNELAESEPVFITPQFSSEPRESASRPAKPGVWTRR